MLCTPFISWALFGWIAFLASPYFSTFTGLIDPLTPSSAIMVLPDFRAGGYLVLTDAINLNSWFLSLMSYHCLLPVDCWLSWISTIISIGYISVRGFLKPFDKEPPDPGDPLWQILLDLFWDSLPSIPIYFYMPRFLLEIFIEYMRAKLQLVFRYLGVWDRLLSKSESLAAKLSPL